MYIYYIRDWTEIDFFWGPGDERERFFSPSCMTNYYLLNIHTVMWLVNHIRTVRKWAGAGEGAGMAEREGLGKAGLISGICEIYLLLPIKKSPFVIFLYHQGASDLTCWRCLLAVPSMNMPLVPLCGELRNSRRGTQVKHLQKSEVTWLLTDCN